jgi:hypothetical protein
VLANNFCRQVGTSPADTGIELNVGYGGGDSEPGHTGELVQRPQHRVRPSLVARPVLVDLVPSIPYFPSTVQHGECVCLE